MANTRAGSVTSVALAFLTLTVVGAVVWLINRDANGAKPSISAGSSMTKEETLADAFAALDQERRRAFEARDVPSLRKVFTPDSPALRKVLASVKRLKRDEIRAEELVSDVTVDVLRVTNSVGSIRQEMTFDLRFFDAANADVTSGGGEERQVIVWTLYRIEDNWKLHSARLTQAGQ